MNAKKLLKQEIASCRDLKLQLLFRNDPSSRELRKYIDQKESRLRGDLAVIEAQDIANRVGIVKRIIRAIKNQHSMRSIPHITLMLVLIVHSVITGVKYNFLDIPPSNMDIFTAVILIGNLLNLKPCHK